MRHEDLEGGDEVCQGDRLVALPLLVGLDVIDEDDEVVLVALVVDLGLLSGALHFDCRLVVVVVGCRKLMLNEVRFVNLSFVKAGLWFVVCGMWKSWVSGVNSGKLIREAAGVTSTS